MASDEEETLRMTSDEERILSDELKTSAVASGEERILSDDLKTSAVASDEGQTSTLAIEYEEHALALASDEEKISDEKLKTSAVANGEEQTSTLASDEEEKTLLCFNANDWLDCTVWQKSDVQFISDAWEGLRYWDQLVRKFVNAARRSNIGLVAVACGGASGREARDTYEGLWEIENETRLVSLGTNLYVQESFEEQGVRVVRPIDEDVNDVLAAIAETYGSNSKGARAVILSKSPCFFSYDRRLSVCSWITVRGSDLILNSTVTKDNFRYPTGIPRTVQPDLGRIATDMEENLWSKRGHANAYLHSLRKKATIERGTTSSSDKRMGNLHSIAQPLRAAVYCKLLQRTAMERIPEWSKDQKKAQWTMVTVHPDPELIPKLEHPLEVVEWLVDKDTKVPDLEPWRDAERMFSICAMAAELVAASSDGATTMHTCMDLFSKDPKIIERTTNRIGIPSHRPSIMLDLESDRSTSSIVQPTSQATQDARDTLNQPVSGTQVVGHQTFETMQQPNPLPVTPSTSQTMTESKTGSDSAYSTTTEKLSEELKTLALASDEEQTLAPALSGEEKTSAVASDEEHGLALASVDEQKLEEELKALAIASDEEKTLAVASDEKEKTLLCFEVNNWLDCTCFEDEGDLQFIEDRWDSLLRLEHLIGKFVKAVQKLNYELMAVACGGVIGREARETYQFWREKEIVDENREVYLGGTLFALESLEKLDVRVVKPIDADVNDVLAAIAEKHVGKSKGGRAVILSTSVCFSSYNRPYVSVCKRLTLRGDELILEPRVAEGRTVQPDLSGIAMDKVENSWSRKGRASAYRPSLRKDARIERGTTSSSDKRLGNLHSIARPLRAAVYAKLGEDFALERIPEWNKDEKMVEWKEIKVFADSTLDFVLKSPVAVLNWFTENDKFPPDLERWRDAERFFNSCALAAELVAAYSDDAITMLECMASFSDHDGIIARTTNRKFNKISLPPAGDTISDLEPASSGTFSEQLLQAISDESKPQASAELDALTLHFSGRRPVVGHPIETMQHQPQTPIPLAASFSTSQLGLPGSSLEDSFGTGSQQPEEEKKKKKKKTKKKKKQQQQKTNKGNKKNNKK